MKKFLTFVLVLAMVMSVSSFAMAAEIEATNADFQTKLSSASAGDTIKLIGDIDVGSGVTIPAGKNITIDLNGFTITSNDDAIRVTAVDTVLTVKDSSDAKTGKITSTGENRGAFYVKDGGKIIVESGNFEGTNNTKCYAAYIGQNGTLVINGGTFAGKGTGSSYGVTIFGSKTSTVNSVLEVNGGSITAEDYAISGNGSYHGTTITINDGIIEGGILGIYHPQNGTLNINGGTVKGKSGIEMRAGTLNMSGGTVTATAAYATPVANGNGKTTQGGVAIAVSQHSTNKAMSINITGGTLNADSGKALHAYDVQDPNPADEPAALSVSGGTFNAPVEVESSANLDIATADGFITGGSFSQNYSEIEAFIEGDPIVAIVDQKTVVGEDDIEAAANNQSNITVQPISGEGDLDLDTTKGNQVVITDNMKDKVTINGQALEPNASPQQIPSKPQTTAKPSSGGGYYGPDVWYIGGNTFGTNTNQVPTSVEIDGVPVSFTMNGSQITVGCIQPGSGWVTVRWGSVSNYRSFTPDANAYCTQTVIPKTGDVSFWAAIAQFLGF